MNNVVFNTLGQPSSALFPLALYLDGNSKVSTKPPRYSTPFILEMQNTEKEWLKLFITSSNINYKAPTWILCLSLVFSIQLCVSKGGIMVLTFYMTTHYSSEQTHMPYNSNVQRKNTTTMPYQSMFEHYNLALVVHCQSLCSLTPFQQNS